MNKPSLTIIVPVYNVENYLIKCIDSIIAQSFTDWELLLVDDGSNDQSGAICDQIAEKDSRVRVFHKENGGVSSARNLGIKVSKGKWITFVDADDFVGESYLQGLLQPLLDGYQLDFVHGGCSNYESDRTTTINQQYDYYLGDDKGRLFSSFRGLVVSKLFKASIIMDNVLCFDESMRIAEDMAFTMDYLLFVDNYAFVPETGYYYRRDNDNSATHHNYWLGYEQSRYNFIHLYNSTLSFIKRFQIDETNSKLRFEQRALHYLQSLRTMYHDNSITRSMRLDILEKDSKYGYFDLLYYIPQDNNYYKTSRLLLDNKFKYFDYTMSIKESIVIIKDFIKSIL